MIIVDAVARQIWLCWYLDGLGIAIDDGTSTGHTAGDCFDWLSLLDVGRVQESTRVERLAFS